MTPKQQAQYEHNMKSIHHIDLNDYGHGQAIVLVDGKIMYPCTCGYRAKNYGGRTNHIWGWQEKQDAARRLNEQA